MVVGSVRGATMVALRALSAIVIVLGTLVWAPSGRAQTFQPLDPRALVLTSEELPPGFAVDPARTTYAERPDGSLAHEVTYVRSQGDAPDPREISFAIVRTASGRDAAQQLAASRQAFAAIGWSEQAVPLLGDEAIGLSLGVVPDAVAHLYLFRFGRHLIASSVAGTPVVTSLDQALGYAVRLSARLDSALAIQPLDDPSPVVAGIPSPPSVPTGPAEAPPSVGSVPSEASAATALPPQSTTSVTTSPPPTAPSPPPATAPTSAGPVTVSVPTIVGDARLEDPPDLADGLKLGGFSGLVALDRSGTSFMTLTDRGPNGEIEVQGKKHLAFPLPLYTPRIVKLRLEGGRLRVTETTPLRLVDGYTDAVTNSRELSGLPTADQGGEDPYEMNGKVRLPFDPNGVDTEGVAIDPRDGTLWVADEYGPSILHVLADGTVIARLVPRGLDLAAPGQNVQGLLPSVLSKRKPNRGLEGIAISPDGSRLFAIMQSPLVNPDKKAGESSRNIRLIALDTTDPNQPTLAGMYVYQAESYKDVGAKEQDDIKIGDLAALSSTRVLVGERDSEEGGGHKKVYVVDLNGATDLASRDDVGGRTLEQASESDLRKAGVEPVRKSLVVDLAKLGYRPDKLEGVAIVDPYTLAVINDNDFGIGAIDNRARIVKSGAMSRLILVRVPEPLQ